MVHLLLYTIGLNIYVAYELKTLLIKPNLFVIIFIIYSAGKDVVVTDVSDPDWWKVSLSSRI